MIEERLTEMGIELPDFGPQTYYGASYGKMKPYHRIANLLVLSGHVPDLPDGTQLFPGRVGAEVTVEQGYAAARQTAINCLAGIKPATWTASRRWSAPSTSSSARRASPIPIWCRVV